MTLHEIVKNLRELSETTQAFTIEGSEWLLVSKPALISALDELLKEFDKIAEEKSAA